MEAEPLAAWTPRRLWALTAATSFATALVFRGRVHPDEVFQVLEPAHRLAFGYGFEAWEWREGLRNWAVVDVVATLLRIFDALHLRDPRGWAALIWLLCSVWQATGAVALYHLIEERDGAGPARLGTLILATWGGFIIYAGRPLGDALAIPAVLLSLLATQRARGWSDGVLAGAALGAAAVARYPSLVFTLPFGLGILASRRVRPVLGFIVGLAAVMAGLGLLDWVTWGRPFHSLLTYSTFNQPKGEVVASFGRSPWWVYLPLFGALAPYFLAWHFFRGLRTHWLAALAFGVYAVLVDIHPHKEERFLLPLVPLGLAIAAAPAWADLRRWWARGRHWAVALGIGYGVWSIVSATLIRPFELGADKIDGEAVLAADPDLRGMILLGEWWSCGGYFYLHRNVPMLLGNINDPRMGAGQSPGGEITHVLAVGQQGRRAQWQEDDWTLVWSRGEVDVWKDARIGAQVPDGGPPRASTTQFRR